MDCINWLEDNYTFFEEIFEYNESYYLEFCLNEEACSFIKLCCKYTIPFAHFPPYGIAIDVSNLELLIKKYEYEKSQDFKQEMFFETHPLLKLD